MASSSTLLVAAVAILAVALLPLLRRLLSGHGHTRSSKGPLPPGSLGLPVIGHTLSFARALRSNTAEEWLRRRAAAHGQVSRLSLFLCPTAFLVGPSANKFLFSSAAVTPKNHPSFSRMVGRRSIREVVGDEHRRVRAMMARFLRPDAVRSYVAGIDAEVRRHLDAEWRGRRTVAVMPSMKSLTFDAMCTVLFRLDREKDASVRRELSVEFQELIRGVWATPINLPFTTYGRCLAASRRGRRTVAGIIQRRRARLESSPGDDDLVSHMVAEGMAEEDIIDNVMFMVVAAHDTTAALLTFVIRHLEANRDAYDKVVAEQAEIARRRKSKGDGEALSWEDLGRMRYTWAAALETLRLVPPIFSALRQTTEDVEYDGYVIPRGWQLLHATNMTHWDPSIFPDPGRYDPARFVAGSQPPPFSFIPFGGGARICPGNEFARVETLVALHYIVTGFSWKLAAGCDGSFSRNPLPYPSQGLLIDINEQPEHA
ncbi:hypothetical protein HU200_034783 [Digitaria exilis]|uniref:Cytochrome P450 n=1 Tax=Digitaria exilis TaxID=1010633 RepID=A0A835BJ98_9POAL|nr:hypothetical protein HU200_034783 [Digitaria exilis]CAB3451643.1 unnamed protein product [Digitaria exilis]